MLLGEPLIEYGTLERRDYGFKFFLEYKASLSRSAGEEWIVLQTLESFRNPGVAEITLGEPAVRWYVLRRNACERLMRILGDSDDAFTRRLRSAECQSGREGNNIRQVTEDPRGGRIKDRMIALICKSLGITNLRFITTLDEMAWNIPLEGPPKSVLTQRLRAYCAREHGEPLLVLRADVKMAGARRLFGKIPLGLVHDNCMYPFGEQGRAGLRHAASAFLDRQDTA